MNHRATTITASPNGHPGSVIRRAMEGLRYAGLFVVACVVLWLAGDEMEEETNNETN